MQGVIGAAARELCMAVMEHAAMCEADPSDSPKISPMINKIHDLVRAYGDALFEQSGWSNPLAGIEEIITESLSDLPSAEERDASEGTAGVRAWASVVDSQAVFVEDPDALMAYAEERTGQSMQSMTDALRALCLVDGWDPTSYPGGLVDLDWRSTDACAG